MEPKPHETEPDRPSIEERQKEKLPQWEEEERFASRHELIRQKFKAGVRKLCALDIWDKVHEWENFVVHELLAEKLGLSRPMVTKGINHGDLTLDTLIIALSALRRELNELPEFPSHQARCYAGFREAVLSVSADNCPPISLEQLICVSALLHELVTDDPDDEQQSLKPDEHAQAWEFVIQRAKTRSAELLRCSEDDVPYQNRNQYDELRRTWGAAVGLCRVAIPAPWKTAIDGGP